MSHLTLDHALYLDSKAYRLQMHARLRRVIAEESRAASRMTVIHEPDNSCCRRETWRLTYARLLESLAADGERVAGVVL